MKLFIIDDQNPEDLAMLQALYSRSDRSLEEHLKKIEETGSTKFLEKYLVQYSHKSIADCSSTTIFIEGVSLLAAKAIQNNPLYNGQETSTRYIDMGKQPIIDPVNTAESKAILNNWMNFYTSKQDAVKKIVQDQHPIKPNEKIRTYNNAVNARAFDILRAFLPAGIATQLSWHTNLRQAGDQLNWLINHPAHEVRNIAGELRTQLGQKYPASGGGMSLASVTCVGNSDDTARAERVKWENQVSTAFTYPSKFRSHVMEQSGGLNPEVYNYKEMLATRPRGCVLPHFFTDLGLITSDFTLDYGSLRDLQRHRNGVCRMPLLNTSCGFEPWYLDQLGDLRDEAVDLLNEQEFRLRDLDINPADRQYLTAIGYRVPCSVTYGLPALVYVMETRANKTVHPTLRKRIHEMINLFSKQYPDIKLHVDLDPDDWDIRRGNQTITEKV